ncbi:gamma-glutamylcyclotransferase family protein [Sphingobium bisphenolivorans]|uniref:gamma-glutamylcyclotransferase family protein n=1 Tax=Sphingobium bisphenolivorans TaxID=1335760 RepID=UPI0003B44C35|nr:gamma-glutamylcyclotransferase family protein [Sphingobium bisphenolivorans]
MSESLLFVYGTLRPGCDDPVAHWLRQEARHVGRATARGRLYWVDTYPAMVPRPDRIVVGDLFALPDAPAILAALDEHEECSEHFPEPREYRRERLVVRGPDGEVEAWAYIYGRDPALLPLIEGGDFLACN